MRSIQAKALCFLNRIDLSKAAPNINPKSISALKAIKAFLNIAFQNKKPHSSIF